ncbi:MAG TPA: excinuclease ABC subunit C [Myxococcales bacterium]|nr:excinuclease ABC subunit C [Myxococcales bacterium]HBU49554.1 excinuclease ABC subunit C [Myxococcales bacterium]
MTVPEHLKHDVESMPDAPGCYLMHDRRDRIVYVGKAKSLRARVRQYFNGHDHRAFVAQIDPVVRRIEWVVTQTEKEALLLESTLIKKHLPRFNLNLKDDRRFLLLRIGRDHDYPRVEAVRRKKADGARYFGPYDSAGQLRRTLRILERHFQLRSCTDGEFKRRKRVCLDYEIGRCSGPCVLPVSQEDYRHDVDAASQFLRGRPAPLKRLLKTRMEAAAEALEYERAGRLRDELQAVEYSLERQSVVLGTTEDLDIIAIRADGDQATAVVLTVRGGALQGKHVSVFDRMHLPQDELLRSFLLAYYDPEGASSEVPPTILCDWKQNSEVMLSWLSDQRAGASVRLYRPRRGSKSDLFQMAEKNAEQELSRHQTRRSERSRALADLARVLRLEAPPLVIDALDISTFQGRQTVAGRVRYDEGKRDPNGTRRLKIDGADAGDDFSAMKRAVKRFYGAHPDELPDLLLIDGGRAQLGAVVKAFEEIGLRQPVIVGLAKSRRLTDGRGFDGASVFGGNQEGRSPERLFRPHRKNPLRTRPEDPGMALLIRMRDEVHDTAIRYHRQRRQKSIKRSVLDDIEGVGPQRRRALLRHFGSVEGLRRAQLQHLRKVPGISAALARRIMLALNQQTSE